MGRVCVVVLAGLSGRFLCDFLFREFVTRLSSGAQVISVVWHLMAAFPFFS